MANFPTSVYSPASKSAGQTITAAFFNDPDGEITAIEDGYLNGVARLNSSHSTVAALSVTGGSTLAGTLQVTGGSSFTVRPVAPPPDVALVFLASTRTIGSSVNSTLGWLSQGILTNSSMHSTGTNPERLIPQATGVYRVAAQLSVSENSTGFRQVIIRDSSGSQVAAQTQPANAVAGNGSLLQAVGLKRFDVVGGYVVLDFVNSGASTLSLGAGIGNSWFSLEKL